MQSAGETQQELDQPKRKLAYIDGMRGAAALYVVLGHLCNMVDPTAREGKLSASPEWLRSLMSPFWYGHLAVAAFIVISGFCLQMSLFERGRGRIVSFWPFYSRRARRILPAYYACLGVSILVALTVTQSLRHDFRFSQYLPVDSQTVWSHLLLYHNYSEDLMYKINGVLWSIAIEVQLYILFPLILAGLVGFGRLVWLAIITVAVAILLPQLPLKSYLWYLPLFISGMALAHMAYRPAPKVGTRPNWFLGIGAVALVLACYGAQDRWYTPIADGLIGVATACFLYTGLVAPWSLPTKVFGWPVLAGVGIFSYSLYLMHHPIQQVMWAFRPAWASEPTLEMLYLVLVALPAMLLISYVFYRLFERPFMTVRRRRAEAAEETKIIEGQTSESLPDAVAAPTAAPAYAEKSSYGLGRRRGRVA